ncbi:hypothetical protein E2L07_16105 [Halalkalibacterium halodurans]|uniref:hypothetical protein n=1 Tax=Halalkalibacterium halodurans TaxID=86665 RepID=UPI0010683164|nr:hypothetical protein [Halalkalibacterium halodurans]TES50315.1 hypothetical protein E2L07_16105 [Halalkalibacterium halodurans]
MNVIVRNLNPTKVKVIDELAKEKGMSRQEFLKVQIEKIATTNELSEIEDKYQLLLEKVILVLEQNTETMKKIYKVIEELSEEDDFHEL